MITIGILFIEVFFQSLVYTEWLKSGIKEEDQSQISNWFIEIHKKGGGVDDSLWDYFSFYGSSGVMVG